LNSYKCMTVAAFVFFALCASLTLAHGECPPPPPNGIAPGTCSWVLVWTDTKNNAGYYECRGGNGNVVYSSEKCDYTESAVPQQGLVTSNVSSSCLPPTGEHLVLDTNYQYPNCVYNCDKGYQFDTQHNCVPSSIESGTSGNSSGQIEVVTSQGTTSVKPGDKTQVTLASGGQTKIKTKCEKIGATLDLVNLVYDGRASGVYPLILLALYTDLNCDKLLSGRKNLHLEKVADSGSVPTSSSTNSPVKMEIELQQGPLRAEVENDQVFLNVDTPTTAVSSEGQNTFGVAYDPNTSKSFVAAYQNPIRVQPSNSNLAPFTLGAGQQVEVDTNQIGSTKATGEAAQIPTGPIGTQAGSSPKIGTTEYLSGNLQGVHAPYQMGGQGATTGTQMNSSPQIPAGVPNSSLIAYYSFDDGTARDNSGNGNDGKLQGGASIVPGKIGEAVSLDGISGSVNIRKTPAFNPGDQMTVSFWMKADPNNAMDKCCQGLVTTDNYGIEISGGKDPRIGVNFFTDTGGSFNHTSDTIGGGSPVSSGQWHHVAGVYDGSSMKLYIDGSLVADRPQSGSISPMLSTSFLAIGSEDGRTYAPNIIGARYFSGLIDEVAIYNRALSAGEVATL
jgi:hypothetical protein